jgi:hypothetical protein
MNNQLTPQGQTMQNTMQHTIVDPDKMTRELLVQEVRSLHRELETQKQTTSQMLSLQNEQLSHEHFHIINTVSVEHDQMMDWLLWQQIDVNTDKPSVVYCPEARVLLVPHTDRQVWLTCFALYYYFSRLQKHTKMSEEGLVLRAISLCFQKSKRSCVQL